MKNIAMVCIFIASLGFIAMFRHAETDIALAILVSSLATAFIIAGWAFNKACIVGSDGS